MLDVLCCCVSGGFVESYKLKIKIGEHEFEAEGPVDIVQDQFATFRDLIATFPGRRAEEAAPPEIQPERDGGGAIATGSPTGLALEKISRVDGRVISLTVTPASVQEAVLVILLCQRHFRSNDSVTGGEIMDGLRQSGHIAARADYVLDKMAAEGLVIRIGIGRARRYPLTNAGVTKAQESAKAFLALIP